MSENTEGGVAEELKKLAHIATDMQLDQKMRTAAIKQLGDMSSHEALLVLLNLAANERLNTNERDLALKQARNIVKKGR
jgi:HEAT repeat protein